MTRPSRLTGLALVLLLLGALATTSTFVWWVERGYTLDVVAPDDAAWTVWVPHPRATMPYFTEGNVVVHGPVETVHGTLLNLTGTGEIRVRFHETGFVVGLELFGTLIDVGLTGREGTWPNGTLWVWRQTAKPTANVTVGGGTGWSASHLGEAWQCGGVGYYGYAGEGWNQVPLGLSDCFGTIYAPPGLIPAILLIPGAVVAFVAWRRQRQISDP